MGFLDKVKDTANKAAEKVQQVAETGQEKFEDVKTKKRISNLKEELGGIVFAQRTGAASADAEAQITRIVADIQAAERELAENERPAASSAGGPSTEASTITPPATSAPTPPASDPPSV